MSCLRTYNDKIIFILCLMLSFFIPNNLQGYSLQAIIDEYMNEQAYLNSTELCSIMNRYGSDKGSGHHNYTTLYSRLFELVRDKPISVFELGVGTNNLDVPSSMGVNGKPGASLYGWREYFINASVYGADIDRRILFNTDRIRTYYCDQRDNLSIRELFSNNDLNDIQFDIIIEDGLHEFDANLNFLINSIHKLKLGGIYIIEDLSSNTRDSFEKILPDLKQEFQLSFIKIIEIPGANTYDNALLIIQK